MLPHSVWNLVSQAVDHPGRHLQAEPASSSLLGPRKEREDGKWAILQMEEQGPWSKQDEWIYAPCSSTDHSVQANLGLTCTCGPAAESQLKAALPGPTLANSSAVLNEVPGFLKLTCYSSSSSGHLPALLTHSPVLLHPTKWEAPSGFTDQAQRGQATLLNSHGKCTGL